MARFSFQLVLILAFLVVCFGFRPRTTGIIRTRNNVVASMTMENIFTDMSVARALGVLPLCIEATSKTTTINDPTAGMTPEEIQNYMSNVGGGMCGVPEIVRTAIGLGLNLSLITFGVFVVSYAILAAMNFVFEKQVEDTFKQVAANASRQYQDDGINFEAIAEEGGAKLSNRDIRLVSNGGSTNTKLNREERRLKARLSKMDEEK